MKSLKIKILVKSNRYNLFNKLPLNYKINKFCFSSKFDDFTKFEDNMIRNDIRPDKKEKTDPHKYQIYKKIYPSLGKDPPLEPMPDFIKGTLEPRTTQHYHKSDAPNSLKLALKHNYPIIREPVASFYRMSVNGMNYHVFNGARYVSCKYILICLKPFGRILSYASYYLQGKNSPLYERNKLNYNDILVIVNAKNLYLTGRKLKYKMYRKPSTKPGSLKEWNAKTYIDKDPYKMIIHSFKGMLPKNKMRERYLKNILIYDGPSHDLNVLGLPQFGNLSPINFNKMFGIEFDSKEDVFIKTNNEEKDKLLEDYKDKGFKIMDSDDNYYRDFHQTGKLETKIKPSSKVLDNIRKKRTNIFNKTKLKAYKYL